MKYYVILKLFHTITGWKTTVHPFDDLSKAKSLVASYKDQDGAVAILTKVL
jgi:hypothetical protein